MNIPEYNYCYKCTEYENNDRLIGIYDKDKGEIFLCQECYELYISENWPICFVAGYEQEINA